MRVALFTDGIWPFVIGGMQKHSFYLCKFLAGRGVFVDLYHTSHNSIPDLYNNSLFTEEELKHIKSFYVVYPKEDKFPGKYIRSSYKYSEQIFKEFIKNPCVDLIYAKGLTATYILKNRERFKVLPKILINVHGYEYYQKAASLKSKIEHLLLRPAFKFVNEKADYIYSYGGKITDIIKAKIPGSEAKIIEIPTGIEEGLISNDPFFVPVKRTFVFIGRNERRKGLKELVKAIKEIENEFDFHFHFIGDIPEKYRIGSQKVTYHGVLKNTKDISNVLLKSEFLVCPSYSEGMPNVILEGMAAGCAIIASNVGAINRQVDETNGILIEPGSQEFLCAALISAIRLQSQSLIKMRKYSIQKVKEQFLWDKIIDQKINSFKDILFDERCN